MKANDYEQFADLLTATSGVAEADLGSWGLKSDYSNNGNINRLLSDSQLYLFQRTTNWCLVWPDIG